ncbi:MAG: hypothetical protein CBD97_03800 [Pelagibacteraceae bacterium TMED237]|nr:hypothetical protein [Candidatus Neomarinimicrobiota bacterium]OUW95037.1 MAG: hypothetical protein CBD97_03800 [Pelagibacteraceae bacterium TMED237]|tara:strand:- start:6925 stop:8040 length:1116 start_codon:yes stop_codon:yes gene_type:complete
MFLITTSIFFIYFGILFWYSNAIYYSKRLKNVTYNHNVSIIISAKNEEYNLPKLIKSLTNQSYPKNKYEIIIANDNSDDKTEELLNQYKKTHKNLRSINIDQTPIGWSSKKWALTKAIEASSSDIILQTDADCIPRNKWIESIVTCFDDANVNFVCGPSYLSHKESFLDKIFRMESLVQEAMNAGSLENNLVLSCTGRNIAFRKEHFNSINGYVGSEHIQSGDDDLLLQKFALKTNGRIQYSINPESLIESKAPINFSSFLKQRLRYASKGLYYFTIKTTLEFKTIIIFLYMINTLFLVLLFSFFHYGNFLYTLPIFFKIAADFLISFIFISKLNQYWSIRAFAVLSFLFPFYVTIIGLLGPLIKIGWKDK